QNRRKHARACCTQKPGTAWKSTTVAPRGKIDLARASDIPEAHTDLPEFRPATERLERDKGRETTRRSQRGGSNAQPRIEFASVRLPGGKRQPWQKLDVLLRASGPIIGRGASKDQCGWSTP